MSQDYFKIPPIISSKSESFDNLGPQSNASLNPFEIEWIFGFNPTVPVINFETITNEVFYVANNTGVFFDLHTKRMSFLNGHQQNIVSSTTDGCGRWLATAGFGIGNVINIWDTTDKSLLTTIANFVPDNSNFIRIGLSPSAKFLVVVHTSSRTIFVNVRLWTYGRQHSDATYSIECDTGAIQSIEFHPNDENQLMIIFEKAALFLYWDAVNFELVYPTLEKNRNLNLGLYTDGTFVENSNECFIGTTVGTLVIYGSFNCDESDREEAKFLKSTVKISNDPITCLATIAEMVVIGDYNGQIHFFDRSLKLLHYFKKTTLPIKSISFKIVPSNQDSSQISEISILGVDFIFATTIGIFHVKFLENFSTQLTETFKTPIAAIDVHTESPFLVIGLTNGQISLYNYETLRKISTYQLMENDENSNEIITLTTLKYSPNSIHLACGRSNGELWFLQPIDLIPIYSRPFQFTTRQIRKITFSFDNLQLAYYDDCMTVYGMIYRAENWHYCGKVRPHYKDIKQILFTNEESFHLYSLGIDRYLIQYDNFEIGSKFDTLKIINRYRIAQKETPLYFIQHSLNSHHFLICDDQYKYRVINSRNSMCMCVALGPAYRQFRNNPIGKIEYLPNDSKYFVFTNRNYIGIQKCPIDGNPFKFIATLGYPEIIDFRISNNGAFVFIIGRNDPTVKMMKIKLQSVEISCELGGEGLQPYYYLLDGGREGLFFEELQDLFYYTQILQQSKENRFPRHISDSINITELPDLVRACGYYPTEFEIENLVTDIRYTNFHETGQINEQASFDDFVKLLINHRPAYGYNFDDLRTCFEIVADEDEDNGVDGVVLKEKFILTLTTIGESLSREDLLKCLHTLLKHDESVSRNQNEIPLPSRIDFRIFSKEILGVIDQNNHKISDESLLN